MKLIKLIILFFFISSIVVAKDAYTKGDLLYKKGDYFLALQNYKAIKSEIEDKAKTQIRIARCYYQLNRMEDAYKTFYDYRDILTGENVYMYATSLNKTGNYKEAIKYYYNVPKELADSLNVKELINSCRWAMRTNTSVPVELNPTRLSDLGQSFGIQYYKNGVVFSSPEEKSNERRLDNHGFGFQNLYYSDLQNNEIASTQKQFSSKLKFPYHIGAISFSHSYTKIYYTKTIQIKDKSILKIFSSSYDENSNDWINETALPFNSDSYNCAHPSVSPNNKYLYFTSDMPNGFGGKDLYRVTIFDKNVFGGVENLGPSINTFGDEMFPFVGLDNALYFSSNGHPGFGSLDVFKATLVDDTWGDVTNLMLPINSSYDDFAYIINPNDKSTGFISSDRGNATDVIYSINNIKKSAVKLSTFIENANDGSPIEKGKVSIIDGNTGEVIGQTISDKFGAFEIIIPEQYRDKNQPLIIKATHINYEPKELKIVASKIQDINNRRIPLKPINENLPKSLYITLVDIYDRSPVPNKRVTLKDKNTNQFIGQSVSNSSGVVSIDIPNEYRKSDQDFNIEMPDGDGYKAQTMTVSMAELDYIKDKGVEMQPVKTEIPADFSARVSSIIDNTPIANAKIYIKETKTGESVGKTNTNTEGKFSVQIPEKFKKDGTVFTIETSNAPGFLDEKLDVSIYNIKKLKDRGLELKPQDKFSISSSLSTSIIGEPISKANVTIKDVNTGAILGEGTSKADGSFVIFISDVHRGTKKYIIEVKKGDEYVQKNVVGSVEDLNKMKTDGISLTPTFSDKMLDEIKTMVISHDRQEISQQGYSTLDKLALYLKSNPKIVIKLNAHTDVRGEQFENLELSQKMADKVKKYLVFKGVKEGNVVPRGYGDRYIINKCLRGKECSLIEHLVNDRIEVVVLRILE